MLNNKYGSDEEMEESIAVETTCECHMTMLDKKVCNAVFGNKSAQCCYICGQSPKDFNKLLTGKIKEGTTSYGIQPLHTYKGLFKCCIHISYRLTVQKWRITAAEDKKKVQERKRKIQKICRDELGLTVDRPKPGGAGNSNDGNTA